ncbi:MAG: hypothetical protein SH817_08380 [Leptospira sp.]|nr:hypothetical protein [Leptospira sp.]
MFQARKLSMELTKKDTTVLRIAAPLVTSNVGASGRIPMATKDTLPQLYITYQMARQISNRLQEIGNELSIRMRELDHYSSSAKHILEMTKEHEEQAVNALKESHERLLGGTMHTMLSSMISAFRASLNDLDARLGNRAKKANSHD